MDQAECGIGKALMRTSAPFFRQTRAVNGCGENAALGIAS
jgi:hypothetical protein